MRQYLKILQLMLLLSIVSGLQGCFWLFPLTEPTELRFATTPDNWKLALHRYKPEQISAEKEPLILVPGFASNRFAFDLARDRSLALYLFERGYDVWMLELRGAGESTTPAYFDMGDWAREGVGPPPNYNFDTFVEIDAPTAIEYVRFETRNEKVSWIGHSLGGMIGYAYLGLNPDTDAIRTFIALGAPSSFKLKSQALNFLLQFKGTVNWQPKIYTRLMAQSMSNNLGWLDTRFDAIIWNNEIIDARTMSMAGYNMVTNLSGPLFNQMTGWMETGEFTSADNAINYADNLDRIRVPTLLVSGSVDALCPPLVARETYEKIGTIEKVMRIAGKANGFTGDYGHMGVVIGNRARDDIYPVVFNWLEQH